MCADLGMLVPVGGGDSIPLRRTSLLIGRRETCDIALQFTNISSRHCELEFVGGYWQLRDLNSSNGTKVNGERITEVFLQPGDVVSFAKHDFEIQYTPDQDAPAPVEENPFGKSLLELAGLSAPERRSRKSRSQIPQAPPPAKGSTPSRPVRKSRQQDEDDIAMQFLSPSDAPRRVRH